MNYFCIDELPRSAWKNGGGTTREILCFPAGADFSTFDWRVSVATISASGPFSRFDGIDRTIMLLEGDGVRLRGNVTDWRLDQPHQPFSFGGEEPLTAELLGGESTDFNVMTRRRVAKASVDILEGSRTIANPAAGLALVLSGSWSVDQRPMRSGQGLWWDAAAGPLRIEKSDPASARMVLVSWTRSSPMITGRCLSAHPADR